MNSLFTPEQEKFRGEVCALLCEESVAAEVARCRVLPPEQEIGLLDAHRRLGERGWLAPNWPREYGGLGATMAEKAIVTEELIRHGVPDNVHVLSVDIVGLGIRLYGTEAQKRRLLPDLARGETSATVLFSEPEVGSDLGALQTRAVRDGDGFRLYGRKTYSMKSHSADFAICAARTTPSEVKYHGITLFIVPLRNPGVLIEPMWNVTEERFADITLNGIRVTGDDVLGEVDQGWHTITQTLNLERSGVDSAAKAARLLDVVLWHAAHTGRLDDPGYGQRLLEIESRVRAARLLAWRCVMDLRDGRPDPVRSAMAKWYATELTKELTGVALDVVGLEGVLDIRDGDAPVAGILDLTHREAPGMTLAAGTSEIMLYLIAGSHLELLS